MSLKMNKCVYCINFKKYIEKQEIVGEERVYSCKKCGKTYTYSSNLEMLIEIPDNHSIIADKVKSGLYVTF